MKATIGKSEPSAYEPLIASGAREAAFFGFARIDAELVAHHFVEVDVGMLRQAADDHLGLFGAEALEFIEGDLFAELALRIGGHLALLHVDRRLHDLAFGLCARGTRRRPSRARRRAARENR